MKTEKNQVWVANDPIELQKCGEGVVHGCVCLEEGILLDIFTPMREDFV